MRQIFLTASLFFLCSILGAAADEQVAGITFPNVQPLNLRKLPPDARRQLAQLQSGITRKQLCEHFDADPGGFIFPLAQRFYLRDTRLRQGQCRLVMIQVAFRPIAMGEATFADPRRRNEWITAHHWPPFFSADADDVVKAFSQPYASAISID